MSKIFLTISAKISDFITMSFVTRFSKKRAHLLDLMKAGTFDHPSAAQVYEFMRKLYPNISMGTVYRNLKFLTSNGDIALVGTVGDCERFDHNTDQHFHLVCQKCGKIMDVPIPANFMKTINNSKEYNVSSMKVLLSGECSECMQK